MKIVITGSLGNIGKPLTQKLVAAGHQVTVVSSNADRKAEIENLGAQAAIGLVSNADFLAQTFNGADAVFAMTPPNLGGSNIIANTVAAGKAYAAAFKQAGIKRIVMLSSIGGHLPAGNGPIAGIHQIEELYKQLDGIAFTFLRAGYFYTNYYNDVPLIKYNNIIGANYPDNVQLLLVHPVDIATAAAEELQRPATGSNIRYVVSDVVTPAQVAKVFGAAIGKPELPWVEFTDDQSLQGMVGAGVPEEIAALYTEMGTGFRNGNIPEHFEQSGSPVTGSIKLDDFAKEFAAKF
ncbi:NmrA family NAD(P)-binding protein [Mucilaginibacter terrae]|uniref:Uncharacterized protein YbjT (DUF2867 family) n=1 Tax=Mucilaginibacter terrae TaxID=1955052 RepID=A0ABU3GW85_9SPHI|nr:NmrA family NAD(P)-binding protein [Mucilaginibacter terrae]MDT3404027.1 uncharacterized protein YbjT (DUF2867 family) [Mucilaginibacter terrae]